MKAFMVHRIANYNLEQAGDVSKFQFYVPSKFRLLGIQLFSNSVAKSSGTNGIVADLKLNLNCNNGKNSHVATYQICNYELIENGDAVNNSQIRETDILLEGEVSGFVECLHKFYNSDDEVIAFEVDLILTGIYEA